MNEITEVLLRACGSINLNYYKLIIIVKTVDSIMDDFVSDLIHTVPYPILNLNLELSSRLIELSMKQRALKVSAIIGELVKNNENGVVLDKTEIMFDMSLKLDPLALLKRLSRDKLIIVLWNGYLSNGKLCYAEPNHVEFKTYTIEDLIVIDAKNYFASEI